jgi:glycosyltransferase involved in cell wall biosynthesis
MKRDKLTILLLGSAAAIHTVKWAKYFANIGHKVHLISYDPPRDEEMGNLELHLIGKKLPIQFWRLNTIINLPFALIQIKRLIKKIKPDIVNAHYVTSYGHLAVFLGLHPLIMTAWGSDILIAPKESLITKIVVKYVLKKADLITCDAEHLKEAMIKLGASPSKIKTINFGIDTQKFCPGLKDENLIKSLGISNHQIVISLRRLEPGYSVETLIKAIPLVIKEIPDTKFLIVSRGSQEEELKRLAKDLGVTESIRFVGQVPNEELPKYIRTADVYVSTSLSDGGISSSTAEAMACELPVIITDIADNKKWVKDGENGFLIPVKNPEILSEKIIYLLKNKGLGKRFGKAARKIIEERNDYYKEMAKMEKIHEELTKNN